MGEIAEAYLDGTFDMETGEYLGEGPGFPRSTHWGRDYSHRTRPSKAVRRRVSMFECRCCDRTFETPESRMQHEIAKHGGNGAKMITTAPTKWFCPACGASYASPESLHDHALAKHGFKVTITASEVSP